MIFQRSCRGVCILLGSLWITVSYQNFQNNWPRSSLNGLQVQILWALFIMCLLLFWAPSISIKQYHIYMLIYGRLGGFKPQVDTLHSRAKLNFISWSETKYCKTPYFSVPLILAKLAFCTPLLIQGATKLWF